MSEYILVLVNLLLVLIEFATFIILLSAFFNIEKQRSIGFWYVPLVF